MAFPVKHTTCKDCGWQCKSCEDKSGLHLHVEIENLKQRLLEREHHIVSMETNFLNEAEKFPNGEFSALNEELLNWQEKYSRLYESHKRVQKVNQGLEDKLLRIVDKFETEKNSLTRDLGNVTHRLVEARSKIKQLEDENERYRLDVNLAIQLLQCKPTNFVSQKIDGLSPELQQHVRLYVNSKRPEGNGSQTPKPEPKIIKVPIPTFPPTAMVYSLNKTVPGVSEREESCGNGRPVDVVSAAIMAKVLEERARERLLAKHCQTCTCSARPHRGTDAGTQTLGETLQLVLPHALIANHGNQGLVRYTDVVATRNSNEFIRNNLAVERNAYSVQESQMSGSRSMRNIRFVSDSALNASNSGTATRNIESMKLSDPILEQSNANGNGKKYGNGNEGAKCNSDIINSQTMKNSGTSSVAKIAVKTSKRAGEVISSTRQTKDAVSIEGLDDVLWSSLSNSETVFPPTNRVAIDMESDPFVPVTARSRDMLYSKLEDQRLQSVFNKSETPRTRSHESRTFLSDDLNNESSRPSPQRLSAGAESRPRKGREAVGPRACSLRVQAGSGNILLENATCYTPVLYTSRPDAQVHSARQSSAAHAALNAGTDS